MNLSHRSVRESDLETICGFPQNAEELYFMFPKANYPLTIVQLRTTVESRSDATVILYNNEIVGFANFYEVERNCYCSIGNVIVNPNYRNRGIAKFLIETMESIAIEKYNVSELHISCFNTNTQALLLYSKLGYFPYGIEKRTTSHEESLALIKLKKQL